MQKQNTHEKDPEKSYFPKHPAKQKLYQNDFLTFIRNFRVQLSK